MSMESTVFVEEFERCILLILSGERFMYVHYMIYERGNEEGDIQTEKK